MATPFLPSARLMSVRLLALTGLAFLASAASAQDISTHVLDLARGVGGEGVPVALDRWDGGAWTRVGHSTTAENGRIESFSDAETIAGTYRLTFDLHDYRLEDRGGVPFFPEIVVPFRVDDPSVHYHVPVVLSPYGYSTYRGN